MLIHIDYIIKLINLETNLLNAVVYLLQSYSVVFRVNQHYVPVPLRVFLLLISSEDLDAPLVLLAGVANGEAAFCRTDLLVVTSPVDSLLDIEVPLNLSFPTVTAVVAVAAAVAVPDADVDVDDDDDNDDDNDDDDDDAAVDDDDDDISTDADVGTDTVDVIAIVIIVAVACAVVVVAVAAVVVTMTMAVAITVVAVLDCLVVNKRLSLCTLLLTLKFDILLELI